MTSDWTNPGAQKENLVRPYGSTGANSSAASKIRNYEDADIQLHDFKSGHFREPLIAGSSSSYSGSEKKNVARPTSLHSLLSSPSSDQQNASLETSVIQHESWIKHPKVREHWKIVLAAAFLSILGLALILTGIGIAVTPSRGYHCLIFGIIGLLCVIPGGYHFVYIYCAALGRPGYQFESLPVLR